MPHARPHTAQPLARVHARVHRRVQTHSGMELLLRRLGELVNEDCLESSVQVTRSAVGTGSPPLREPNLTCSSRGPRRLLPPPPQCPLHQSRHTAVPTWWLSHTGQAFYSEGPATVPKPSPGTQTSHAKAVWAGGCPVLPRPGALALIHPSGLGARPLHTGLSKHVSSRCISSLLQRSPHSPSRR